MIYNLETILIIFKQPRWPHEFIISKFSQNYKVEHIFISNLIEKFNPSEIVVADTKQVLIDDSFLISSKTSVIKYLLKPFLIILIFPSYFSS